MEGMVFDFQDKMVLSAEEVLPDVNYVFGETFYDAKELFRDAVQDLRFKEFANSTKAKFKAKKEVLVDAVSPLLAKVKLRGFSIENLMRPFTGSYTLHAMFGLGVISFFLSLTLLSVLMSSSKSIGMAIGCVEQACTVLFSIKTLLLLPFLQFLAVCAVTAAFTVPILQVLSTIPVTSESFTIAGIEVNGIAVVPSQFSPLGPFTSVAFRLVMDPGAHLRVVSLCGVVRNSAMVLCP